MTMAPASNLQVRVQRTEWLCDGVLEFTLVPTEDGALPRFTAGSHIDVQVPGSGTRQYSLVNTEDEQDRYVIAVRRDAAGRGGSRGMHERVRAGDVLRVSQPRNLFALDPAASNYWLVAGGIGITPLLAMARTLHRQGKPFRLFFCTRAPHLTPYHGPILRAPWAGNVTFIHDGGNPGKGLDLRRLLNGWTHGTQVYACGPSPMLDALLAEGRQLPRGALHVERFDPTASAGPEFTVRLARTGRVIAVGPDRTILDCLRDGGIEVDSSCEQGICGTCRVGLLGGTPDHRCHVLSDDERRANDQLMVCVSRASAGAELVLDL